MPEKKKVIAIITAVTGDRIIICREEMEHAMRHFLLPEDIFLELLERVLKYPDDVYADDSLGGKIYHLFYHLFDDRYILAVVKIIRDGAYFTSMYFTGKDVRKSHKKFKKLKL